MSVKKFYNLVFLATILLFSLCACKEEDDLKFNHKFHIDEAGAKCADCHAAGKDGKMGNPSMDKCGECHEIEMDKPSEKCLKCHSVESSKKDYAVVMKSYQKGESYKDVKFKHEYHDGVDCNTCHKGIDKNASLKDIAWPTMKTCYECHNGKDAPSDCEICHTHLTKEKAPENHHGDWAKLHGIESRFNKNCEYCHDNNKNFCRDCHLTNKPKDHIANWKTTQHGIEATHDRRLCATCHTASYCADCHQSQKPISHARGDWMAYTRENGHAEAAHHNFRSCNVCHNQSECIHCHNTIILRNRKR
jgi:hypothetical protein